MFLTSATVIFLCLPSELLADYFIECAQPPGLFLESPDLFHDYETANIDFWPSLLSIRCRPIAI